MNNPLIELKFHFREMVKGNPKLRGVEADRLTATAVAANGVKRYFEGYYGKRFTDKLEEGRKLRESNPKAYVDALARREHLTSDLRSISKELRIVETLTTSDLTYAIGATREIEQRDPQPTFATDLYQIVRLKTRDDLTPITTGGGVNLIDRFLAVRPEGTPHKRTGWIGSNETYTMANWELGYELTWEALLQNRLNEWLDAMFELGQAAARTRAWVILEAIRLGATRLVLPDAAFGPNIGNLTAAEAWLGDQTIRGHHYSRGMTDVFVPFNWRATAEVAFKTQNVAFTGGASDTLTARSTANPVYGLATVHPETIITEAPIDTTMFPGHTNKDWIVADRNTVPVEMSRLAGFEAGPRILTKLSDIVELDTIGSFADHIIEVKVSDVVGAVVRDKSGVLLVAGQ